MTTATNNAPANNETQKEGNVDMNTEVKGQAADTSVQATAELTKNTSWTAFQKTCDDIAKDLKTDTQELEMIRDMLSVEDQFSLENVEHLIKGDKELYPAAPRKNKAATAVTKPSAANQQRACLLLMLPHYKAWQKEKAQRIVDFENELKAATEERRKVNKRNMTAKQKAAMFDTVTTETYGKNATKSFAELKIEAIEGMFKRAMPKVFFLRKISASDMTVDVKSKTCTYTAWDHTTKVENGNTNIVLLSTKSEVTHTLAELKHYATLFTGYYKITATRSTGKISKAEKKAAEAKAAAAINAVSTASENAKAMSEHIAVVSKSKKDLAQFRKQQQPKVLFDKLFAALFVTEKVLDVAALQLAIDHAVAKAEISSKCTVSFDEVKAA